MSTSAPSSFIPAPTAFLHPERIAFHFRGAFCHNCIHYLPGSLVGCGKKCDCQTVADALARELARIGQEKNTRQDQQD